MMFYRSHVLVCGGNSCTSSGSLYVFNRFEELLKARKLENDIKVVRMGCAGLCESGPIVIVYPEGAYYSRVKVEDVEEIITEHLVGGKIVERLLYKEAKVSEGSNSLNDTEFYKKQTRIVLKNCGVINPESIEEYIAVDGYRALGKALTEMQPKDVVTVVKESGLRGRGGAGFLTGQKWEFAAKSQGTEKYILCNADEGDPGAFMDRAVLEGDPHAVLEAMTICGYAVGASHGIIYVRAEYPVAVQRLVVAIRQSREYGLLGSNLFGTAFSFDIETRLGAGAFVCGEETAMIASIEGHRGEPRSKPPFPSDKGVFGKPTIINNVETFANIPQIIMRGAKWFSSIGTAKSKGTKVFALGGKINNTGLVEVPMGTTLREIIYDVGGGIPGGKKFKAAQTGGPSGGCIPSQFLDTPIDYESLTAIGSMMGSGGLIIMDETTCMVDIARYFLDFTADESCGKCVPCRIGTKRMLEILERIVDGRGKEGDIETLETLAGSIRKTALCNLGMSAPNPVLTTIKYFRSEYEAHIRDKHCPAGHCKALLSYHVDAEKCIGCALCTKHCPVGAITGERKKAHEIDQEKCIRCGVCEDNCKFQAILKK